MLTRKIYKFTKIAITKIRMVRGGLVGIFSQVHIKSIFLQHYRPSIQTLEMQQHRKMALFRHKTGF